MQAEAFPKIHPGQQVSERHLVGRRVRHADALPWRPSDTTAAKVPSTMLDTKDLWAMIIMAFILIAASLGYSGEFYG
jgi:hypothetical protein